MSKQLFPKIKPFSQQHLSVSADHDIYIEQSGNQNGIAVIYLHGGPGGGACDDHRRYFDPEYYHIILMDQRGCGRSIPSPSTDENTTWDIVNDIEKVREHLGIKRWVVAGGSWGTTLALAYGISHPDKVLAFVLRGIFLGTEQEYNWLYNADGAARFFPEYYQEFLSILPPEKQAEPLAAYDEILKSDNEVAVISAAKAWFLWEARLSSIEYGNVSSAHITDTHQALSMAKISSHFFNNQCYFSPNYILEQIDKVSHIPATIIHGRYDMVCQLDIADKLVKLWDNASLQVLPLAGHSGFETQTIDAICKATDATYHFLKEQDIN